MLNPENRADLLKNLKFLLFNMLYLVLIFSLIKCPSPLEVDNSDEVKTMEGVHNVKPFNTRERLIHNHLSDLIGDRRTALLVMKYADRYELELNFLYALIKVESGFDSFKITRRGDLGIRVGLCQLNPADFVELEIKELIDEEVNIGKGAALLRECLDIYEENPVMALASYREGKSRILKKQLGKESLDYIQAIFIEQDEIALSIKEYLKEHEFLL